MKISTLQRPLFMFFIFAACVCLNKDGVLSQDNPPAIVEDEWIWEFDDGDVSTREVQPATQKIKYEFEYYNYAGETKQTPPSPEEMVIEYTSKSPFDNREYTFTLVYAGYYYQHTLTMSVGLEDGSIFQKKVGVQISTIERVQFYDNFCILIGRHRISEIIKITLPQFTIEENIFCYDPSMSPSGKNIIAKRGHQIHFLPSQFSSDLLIHLLPNVDPTPKSEDGKVSFDESFDYGTPIFPLENAISGNYTVEIFDKSASYDNLKPGIKWSGQDELAFCVATRGRVLFALVFDLRREGFCKVSMTRIFSESSDKPERFYFDDYDFSEDSFKLLMKNEIVKTIPLSEFTINYTIPTGVNGKSSNITIPMCIWNPHCVGCY